MGGIVGVPCFGRSPPLFPGGELPADLGYIRVTAPVTVNEITTTSRNGNKWCRSGDAELILGQEGVDEGGRLERGQVVGALAEPDQLDRHAELPLHLNDDATLC